MTIAELRKKRAAAYDSFAAIATKDTVLTEEETKNYADLKKAVTDLDAQIDRAVEAQQLAARSAVAVGDDVEGTWVLFQWPQVLAGRFAVWRPAGFPGRELAQGPASRELAGRKRRDHRNRWRLGGGVQDRIA